MSEAPPGERQEQRNVAGVAMGGFLAACWAFPSRALAASAIVGDAGGGEMGARVDPAATSAFGLVALAFAFLQVLYIGMHVARCRRALTAVQSLRVIRAEVLSEQELVVWH